MAGKRSQVDDSASGGPEPLQAGNPLHPVQLGRSGVVEEEPNESRGRPQGVDGRHP